ncbi:MAG: hypothetical protein JSS20_06285 [Proteobacteria bacterium]|nr:hypothetical protein [Pseudomonadota bacterium]
MDRPADEAPRPMYSPSQLRMLRISVVVMGVILLFGFVAVIGRIVWLVNSGSQKPPQASVAAPGSAMPAATVPVQPAPLSRNLPPLGLPLGAGVRSISLSGDRLAVHFEGPQGSGLKIIDLSGREPGLTIPIVTEGGPQK